MQNTLVRNLKSNQLPVTSLPAGEAGNQKKLASNFTCALRLGAISFLVLWPIVDLRAEDSSPQIVPAPQVNVREESQPIFDPEEFDKNHPKAGISKVAPADQYFVNLRKRNQKFDEEQKKRRYDFVTGIRKQSLSDTERSQALRDFNREMKERGEKQQKEIKESLQKRQKTLDKFFKEQKDRRKKITEEIQQSSLTPEEKSAKFAEFNLKERKREEKLFEDVAKEDVLKVFGLPMIKLSE